MRVAISTQPGLGHINAMIPFALALRKRGHEVVMLGPPSVAQTCGQADVLAAAVTVEPYPSGDPRLLEVIPELNVAPQDRMKVFRREVSVKRRAISSCVGLKAFMATWRPNVMLRDSTELGAWAACEYLGIPHVSVEIGLFWSEADYVNAAGEELRQLRMKVGLNKAANPAEGLYRFLHLSNSPPGFLPPDVTLPAATQTYRPTFFDDYGGVDPVSSRQTGSECAYMAFGTLYDAPKAMAIEMAHILTTRFDTVFVCGDYSVDFDRIITASYIPQSAMMKRCSLVVCHGGRSTVLTALSFGLPVICLPLASDHFFVASRIAELGLGADCGWNICEFGSATLDWKLERYALAAAKYSTQILAMRTVGECVEAIEQVAMSR